jgi:hypothetical protein
MTTVVGIDPGLVHTGAVRMSFDRQHKTVTTLSEVFNGPDVPAVKAWIGRADAVFIEGYRARSNFSTDQRMVTAVSEFRKGLGGTVLQNMGVKKVVKSPLMELLGVWKFDLVTHHQDLRSAARIALLGMLKDDHLNKLLTDIVADHLAGKDWTCT